MVKGVSYSKPWALAALVGILAAASTGVWRAAVGADVARETEAENRRRRERLQAIAHLAPFDDGQLALARRRAHEHPARFAVDGDWDRWAAALGGDWQISPREIIAHPTYTVSKATARLIAPSVADWSRIVAAVGEIERRPGFGVLEIELASSGDRRRRAMETVRLVVAMGAARPADIPPSP